MQFDPFQSPIGIALDVVFLYVTVSFIVSCFGWRQLASRYATASRPVGITFRSVSGRIALLGGYGRCLNVVSSPAGVYVETQLPFRLFHRPLLFPWRCVSHIDPTGGVLWPVTRLTIATGIFDFSLRLPGRAAAELQRHAPHAPMSAPQILTDE